MNENYVQINHMFESKSWWTLFVVCAMFVIVITTNFSMFE